MKKYFEINAVNTFMKLKHIGLLMLIGFSVVVLNAQTINEDELQNLENFDNIYQTEIINGDTMPLVLLQPVAVIASRDKRDYVAEYKFRRLKRYVTKVYPYAKEAGRIIDEINTITADIDKKRKQKKYIRKLEKDLKATFEDELKKLTISQGKILTKLLHRETGLTTHQLVKKYKNGLSAGFYQLVGKRFGYDLKKGYDPINNAYDKDIESIVIGIEMNTL